jgi:hypothetical protein
MLRDAAKGRKRVFTSAIMLSCCTSNRDKKTKNSVALIIVQFIISDGKCFLFPLIIQKLTKIKSSESAANNCTPIRRMKHNLNIAQHLTYCSNSTRDILSDLLHAPYSSILRQKRANRREIGKMPKMPKISFLSGRHSVFRRVPLRPAGRSCRRHPAHSGIKLCTINRVVIDGSRLSCAYRSKRLLPAVEQGPDLSFRPRNVHHVQDNHCPLPTHYQRQLEFAAQVDQDELSARGHAASDPGPSMHSR